jgi:hypothetical protein
MAGDDVALYRFGLFLLGALAIILALIFAFKVEERLSQTALIWATGASKEG